MDPLVWKASIWLAAGLILIQPLSATACYCPCEADHDVHTQDPSQRLSCLSSIDAAGHTACTCPDTCRCKLRSASEDSIPATAIKRVNRNRWHSQAALELPGKDDFGRALRESPVTAWPILCATVSRTCVELCRFHL